MAPKSEYPWRSMIGKRFGYYTVLEYDHTASYGAVYFLCECDCGTRKVVRASHLRSGRIVSCGCKRREITTEDLTGKRFGRLEVLKFDHMDSYGCQYWICKCDCGNISCVSRNALLTHRTESCGCLTLKKNTKHGMSNDPLYSIWHSMISRCENPNNHKYYRYGERGITVCKEWHDPRIFKEWALDNGYSEKLTIDRIDNDKGYYPKNCRWVSLQVQANNKSTNHLVTYNRETHTVSEWSKILNIKYATLLNRISHNNMIDFDEYFDKGGLADDPS